MPRRPRIFVSGFSQHVIQRGNNRADVFVQREDYSRYLLFLKYVAASHGVAVHAYVLMTNHVHLIVSPPSAEALSKMMQNLGRAYAQTFNERHRRTGGLWEGRYRSTLIADEGYFLTCHRYVELNPVRAAMVGSPQSYRWSSSRFYALGEPDPLVTPHSLYLQLGTTAEERQRAWRDTCGVPLDDNELAEMRETRVRTPCRAAAQP
jgi:putative transposase